MRVGISMGEEIDRRNQLNHSSLNLSQQSRPNVVKNVRHSKIVKRNVRCLKKIVKSPVFDVQKGPVFDGGNDVGKGPVFDVEIVSTLSPLHNHTSAVALSAVTSH